MPLFELSTNTTVDDEQEIAEQASRFIAELLGKPESYVMVRLQTQQTLLFAGSKEPAAHIKLKSLGLPENRTSEFSASLCEFISSLTKIETSRIYIEFFSPERHMWGWDNKTF
jgi:phenylpyruvate tautomerase PptA (4-oxalocrotonate tautomerase family)